MDKLLIVDGHNLLFQMFFGMPSRIVNKNGVAIWGTLGFVGALLKIIKQVNPTHAVVIFDGETHNERTDISADYKANRPDWSAVEAEMNPFSQLPDVIKALNYLKIKYFETVDCECDDVISSYVYAYGNECEIVISSFDSDFFQLVSEKVSVLRYRGKNSVICTPQYVLQKTGVSPELYLHFNCLTGDGSDNIKGVCKIGQKTAAQLINKFGTVQNLIANADLIERESIRLSVKQSEQTILTNYRLIKLGDCARLPYDLCQLNISKINASTMQVLKAIGL